MYYVRKIARFCTIVVDQYISYQLSFDTNTKNPWLPRLPLHHQLLLCLGSWNLALSFSSTLCSLLSPFPKKSTNFYFAYDASTAFFPSTSTGKAMVAASSPLRLWHKRYYQHLRWDSLRYDQRPTFHQQGLGEEAREEVSCEEHTSLKAKLCLPRCQHNRWIWAPPKRPILHRHLLPECHWIRHLLEQGISAQDHPSSHLRDPLILLMLLVNLSLTCIQHWMESKNPSP